MSLDKKIDSITGYCRKGKGISGWEIVLADGTKTEFFGMHHEGDEFTQKISFRD